jgi:hypothetical protein
MLVTRSLDTRQHVTASGRSLARSNRAGGNPFARDVLEALKDE